jgi:hypothetical protein
MPPSHVAVSKFEHHLPLYQQSEMMAAQGLDINRSTLAGWVGQAAALLVPSSAASARKCCKATRSTRTTRQSRCSTPVADAPRPGDCGSMRSTTAPRATRPRLRHGIASRPTAPVYIRKPILPDFEVSSRPTPMPVTTRSIEAASPKSRNGHISGARCSTPAFAGAGSARAGCHAADHRHS